MPRLEVDHVWMNWLPPGSRATRSEWAEARPWLAGCYFATFMSVFAAFLFPLLIDSPASVGFKVLVGLLTWPLSATLFALGLKRRWGQRPEAEASPDPTARRIWSRASDRFLLGFMWLGIGGTVSWAVGLITGVDESWRAAIGIACGVWLATTTWAERRRRRIHL